MATIRERLVYAIEVVADKAGLRGFESSVAQAEGTVGRFKSTTGSAFDTIRQNAGLLAVAAGGAAVAIGTKLVGSFQDAALAAGKLSDATGLTVEDASRLQEVAGDLGVSTESLETSIVKLNRAAGKGDLAKFGIDVQKAADGTTDVNATFLQTIRVIQGIADPTEKALAAQAAFGRGYAQIAELVGTSASELKDRLDSVADGRVINERELKQAREFRDNVDDLKDSAEALGLTLGGVVVPALNDVITGFRDWFKGIGDAGSALGDFLRTGNLNNTHIVEEFNAGRDAARDFDMTLLDGLTTFEQVRNKVLDLTGSMDAANVVALEWKRSQTDLNAAAEDGADAIADLGDRAANSGPKIGDMAGALDDAAQHLADLNEEARNNALDALANAAQGVADAIDAAFTEVRDNLDLQDLVDNITDQFGEIADAAKNATDPEGIRKYNRSVRELQRQLLTLLDSIDGIPPDKKVQIAADIQRGGVDELYRILGDLEKGVTVPVSFATAPTPAFSSVNAVFSPGTAPSTPIFNNPNPAPAGATSGYIDNSTTIINNPIGSTPTTQYIDGQTDFRRNGLR